MEIINIAVFASGAGSNAEKIMQFFARHPFIKVNLVVSNRKEALVLDLAKKAGFNTAFVSKKVLYESKDVLTLLKKHNIRWVILAGFLLKVPPYLLDCYPDKIINIHPSLLPKHGGKGMYGIHVHKAVHAAKEEKTGITVHLLNEEYDKGHIIAQVSCPVKPDDSPLDIQKRVQVLEHAYYPNIISQEIQLAQLP